MRSLATKLQMRPTCSVGSLTEVKAAVQDGPSQTDIQKCYFNTLVLGIHGNESFLKYAIVYFAFKSTCQVYFLGLLMDPH